MTMTREELLRLHEELCNRGRELMKGKNEDYSKGTALGNFYVAEALQACSAENGIIVRMSDKLSRLVSIIAKGNKVKDEGHLDTVVDIINYAILLGAVIKEKNIHQGGSVPEC